MVGLHDSNMYQLDTQSPALIVTVGASGCWSVFPFSQQAVINGGLAAALGRKQLLQAPCWARYPHLQ